MSEKIDDDLFKRLVLVNQYTILAKLADDEEDAKMWSRAADTVEKNWPIDELPLMDSLTSYARTPFNANKRREMFDTLDLFQVLQDAEDKGLKPTDPEARGTTAFPGYDGNNEGQFYGYYVDLVEQGQRWTSLRRAGRGLNSHMPVRETYRRLVERWQSMGSPRDLDQAQFDAILAEWTHPSRR